MADTATKKYMTDENGNQFYPIGHVDAIYTKDGDFLGDMIKNGWGTQWYTGTAMSGTSTTTGYYSYSSCPTVKLNDIYLNTSYGYIYQCTTAGSGSNAKWTYKGSIRGATGTGTTGQRGSKWFTGTALSGTSSGTNYTWSDSEQKYVGDMYLNTSTGNVYKCTTAGTTGAYWQYQGSIRGAAGQNGSNANANDRVPYIETKTDTKGETWKIVYNTILNGTSLYNLTGNTTNNYKFVNCIFQNAYTVATQWKDTDGEVHTTCRSGFQMPDSRLEFINCVIHMDSNNLDPWLSGNVSSNDEELNFIYSCKSYKIDACTFILKGADYPLNIIKDGTGIISNTRFEAINYYGESTTSQWYPCYNIHHYNTDHVSRGVFVGNYVEFGNAMNIQAGVIGDNEFIAMGSKGTDDNIIYLECPTCMAGNHFKGYAVRLNGRNYKHIIDRNLSDGGLTIKATASGSVVTNNLQY